MGKAEMAKMLRTAQRIAKLEQELVELRRQLRDDVVKAHESGESVSELARRLGVTRSRIYQLLDR
jgi:transposase-like protein